MDRTYFENKLAFMVVALILTILALVLIGPYFTVVMVSLISVIVLKPLFDWILRRRWIKGRRNVAAAVTLACFLLILVIPVFVIAWVAISQLSDAFSQMSDIDLEAALQGYVESLEGPPYRDAIQSAASIVEGIQTLAAAAGVALVNLAVSIVSSLPGAMIQGLLFVVLVGALLPPYDGITAGRHALSPLGPELSELYSRKITAMVRSLVQGVFLISIIQGAAMGVFFWIAGLPYVFLLTLLSMFLALIPMVGISWLVIAIAVISFLTGSNMQGIIVLVGFYGGVNWIDVILRPKLISEEAHLPLALFILSLFGGLAWAGLMGLFYGPVIMLLLVTTIQIYADKYASEDGRALHGAYTRMADSALARREASVSAKADVADGADLADAEAASEAEQLPSVNGSGSASGAQDAHSETAETAAD